MKLAKFSGLNYSFWTRHSVITSSHFAATWHCHHLRPQWRGQALQPHCSTITWRWESRKTHLPWVPTAWLISIHRFMLTRLSGQERLLLLLQSRSVRTCSSRKKHVGSTDGRPRVRVQGRRSIVVLVVTSSTAAKALSRLISVNTAARSPSSARQLTLHFLNPLLFNPFWSTFYLNKNNLNKI